MCADAAAVALKCRPRTSNIKGVGLQVDDPGVTVVLILVPLLDQSNKNVCDWQK